MFISDRDQPQQQQQQQPDLHSPSSQHSTSSLQRQRPDLYVDIPHTYVNVYDGNQVRGKLGSYDRPSHNTATHYYSDRDPTSMWISHTPMSMFMMATKLEVS